ncbi:MAG TPA: ROK family protein [Longimicrobium sp.]
MRKINVRDFRRATRSTAREINRQIVLNLVREHQPISRADLARRMEVGRGMVTALITDLLAEGALVEGETVDAPRGRKPKMLFVRTHDRLVVAVDIRFSRTYVMLSDFGGTQIALETFATTFEPAELVSEIAGRVERLTRAHGAVGSVEGIGLVVPGLVDRYTGRVLNAPQLGWKDVDIRDALSVATGLPVFIENAPMACALAQMWMGQRGGDGGGDFVYVTVSDGVGTGIVVNGQLLRGTGNTAGEFGHIPLDPDGPECLCGRFGCWEAYTSNLATLSRYLGSTARQSRDLLQTIGITVPELINRARTGDDKARAAILETGRYLGMGLGNVINALNPSRIIVGGEITAAWDLIEGEVREAMVSRSFSSAAETMPIIPEQSTEYPRLRGATALVAVQSFAAPRVA